MTTKVGFFNKDGKDIIEAIYESEGKIGFKEGEEGHYKNFNPTNLDVEMILEHYNNEYFYYSNPARRWLNHKKEIQINNACFDQYLIYSASSFVSFALPKHTNKLSQAHIDGLAVLKEIYCCDEVIDGWYYQFVHTSSGTYLTLSLDPHKPLIKLDVSGDTVEECQSKITGAILTFIIEWESYLANIPEGIAIKQYLMENLRGVGPMARNMVPLVTTTGTIYSLLMMPIIIRDADSRIIVSEDGIPLIPFVYALKQRFDHFVDNVWLVNNPIN